VYAVRNGKAKSRLGVTYWLMEKFVCDGLSPQMIGGMSRLVKQLFVSDKFLVCR
jgi:hypothetical protein